MRPAIVAQRPSPSLTRRVKLLQGAQFIYLHRGLPKVCVVDRQSRCLSWGSLQLVMRDTQQLNNVLSVLRHADVQHRAVWPPQISMLWLEEPNRAGDEELAERLGANVGSSAKDSKWSFYPTEWTFQGLLSQLLQQTLRPSTTGMLLFLGSAALVVGYTWHRRAEACGYRGIH